MKMSFVTITVKNMEESIKFYTEVLRLNVLKSFSTQQGISITFLKGDDGGMVELIEYGDNSQVQEKSRSIVSIGISVKNLDKEMKNLEELNVPIIRGPINVPSGERFLFIEDPNGVEIELIEGFEK